jgi:hypothetical protein
MPGDFECLRLPACFTGVVRLFPLPHLVLFPGVIQPLYFELPIGRWWRLWAVDESPRLMKPGWEPQPEDRP